MNSTTVPFNKMTLALVFSVSGMLLSLSALAIATNDVKHELQTISVDKKVIEIKAAVLLVQVP
jgi:hypothetical protein